LVIKHLGDPEPELQDAALSLVRGFPGPEATQAFAQRLSNLSPPRAALLLRALADREDRSVLPIVISSLESSDDGVRTAALYAIGRLGDADVVARLAQVASTATGAEQAAARESLTVLRGSTVDATMIAHMDISSTAARAELAAALGSRNSVAAVKTLLRTATDDDQALRLASIRSLGNLAATEDLPALVDLLLKATGSDEHAAAAKSVVDTARRIAEPEGRLTVVLNALSESKLPAARVRLLPVVGQIGGTRAVATVESALRDESADVRDAAVRTLAAWSTPETLSALLNVVKTSQHPDQRLLALQGYIRLLGMAADRSPQQRLAGYEEAFRLATRLDEKRQILAGIPRVRVPETLRFVLPLLTDPELSEDAARAAVLLSTVGRRSEISRDEARAAMRQVLGVAKTPAIREAATAILESPERR
jgi:HEAT repeat protein